MATTGKGRKPTARQQRFVEEYMVSMDAGKAYQGAFEYKGKNQYSLGYALLQNSVVRKLIDKATAERSKRTAVDADFVLGELVKVAKKTLVDDDIKAVDKLRALEMLGKNLKLFSDKVEVEGNLTIVVETGVPRTPEDDDV